MITKLEWVIIASIVLLGLLFPFLLVGLLWVAVPLAKAKHLDYTPSKDRYDRVPPRYYKAYREYLQSTAWKHLRQKVLLRDDYRCTSCGVTDTVLYIHHIHYTGIDTMTFVPKQLITLCSKCHDIAHKRN